MSGWSVTSVSLTRCPIGRHPDVAAIGNVWWMFLVDKTGKVNNSIR
jgi:hypothetical protein